MDWLSPPTFEDAERTERAAIVWATLLLGLTVCVVQAVINLATAMEPVGLIYLLVEFTTLGGALLAVRRGAVDGPVLGLLAVLTTLVTTLVFFGGGLELAFPPLLGTIALMGALLRGPRTGLALTAWTVVCTVVAYVVGTSDVLIMADQDRGAVRFTVQLVTVLLGGVLVNYAVHRLSLALRAQREQAEVATNSNERLRSSRRFVQDVLQSMAEAVLVTDTAGAVRVANDTAAALYGCAEASELHGRRVQELLEAPGLAQDPTDRSHDDGFALIADAPVPVRVARSPVTGEDGSPLQVFVISDVRQLKQAQQRAEEAARVAEAASRAKSQFLANMSHELRTPLNAVIGYSDMLLDDLSDAEQQDDVRRIRGAGRHLLSLINDVLDMSKIEAGRMEAHPEVIRLDEVLNEVQEAVTPVAQRRGNQIVLDKAQGFDQLFTDRRMLVQVLMNLLSNAAKFTEQGTLTMRARDEGSHWVFAVEDTGIGISAAQLDRLFQPFVQADNSTSRRYGGTGLGLALSRRLVELLGGQLDVESEEGEGSTFTVRLPVRHASEETPAPVIDGGDAPLVLCVDDDANTLQLLARVLRREGLRVATAASGADALALAKEHPPAVITLDVMMPEMDGWTLLQRVRATPELQDVPVVMVSMVDDDEGTAVAFGASDYLVKPVDSAVLVKTVGRYLRGGGGSVLVVDDEDDILELLRRSLSGEGWTVATASGGQEALDLLPEVQPDIVVLDLSMPGMDGFGFLDRVRRHTRWRDLPVVVLTAMDLSNEQWADLAARTTQVVQKGDRDLGRVLAQVRRFAHKR